MRRAIVGTAGHVDHGKTSLVLALTGIDCDRFAEEKSRGITIDLGFAHLAEEGVQLGFVDVPGHERFLHNALAGLGGVRILLLVVAVDEGVKPQTLEHLAIASLLDIPAALVALTKTDLASEELVELAALEIDETLAATPFAGARVVPVSSTTGAGIPELKAALLDLGKRFAAPADARPARLPVDRAFHLKGLGVVVTGTLAAGTLATADHLEVLPPPPGAPRVRVRSLQVHGEPREQALAGERTSAQLSGVELEVLRRGVELVAPGSYEPTRSLLARYRLLPDSPGGELTGWTPVRCHLYAAEAMGRLRPLAPPVLAPGEEGIVEIRLAAPIVAARGDRFILRRPSPPHTLGGGSVLDPLWRRHRGTVLPAALKALSADVPEALAFWAEEAGERGLDAAAAARRLGWQAGAVTPLLRDIANAGKLVPVASGTGGAAASYLAPRALFRVEERAKHVLAEHFRKDRLATGMPKAEAVRRILRGRGAELAGFYFDWLASRKVLVVREDTVNLPGRTAELDPLESKLAQAILTRIEAAGLTPDSPAELCRDLAAKPQILDGVVRHLVSRGQLARLSSGLILSAGALSDLRQKLFDAPWERFSVVEFKDRFGLTRKWAIPLLEHLDSIGATRRQGDERIVVRPK